MGHPGARTVRPAPPVVKRVTELKWRPCAGPPHKPLAQPARPRQDRGAMNQITDPATTWLHDAGHRARAASTVLANTPDAQRAAGLRAAAVRLRAQAPAVLQANEADLQAHQGTPGLPRPPRPDACTGRGDGRRPGRHRHPARSPRPHAHGLDQAQWPPHPPHPAALGRDRHDLRVPSQCGRRRRRAVREVRQRRPAARRLGQPALRTRHSCRHCRGPGRCRPPHRRRADRARHGPRLRRRHAGGGGAAGPCGSPRRPVVGRARATRRPRSRARPCRGPVPHLRPRCRRPGDGPRRPGKRQDAPHRLVRCDRDAAD